MTALRFWRRRRASTSRFDESSPRRNSPTGRTMEPESRYMHPEMLGAVVHRRVDLRPDLFEPGTHRFLFEGWGVIHLQFVFQPLDPLWESRVTCNSETRAGTWADTIHDLGNPSDWEWRCVQREYRRLCSIIRRLAVFKIGGAAVLPSVGAAPWNRGQVASWG